MAAGLVRSPGAEGADEGIDMQAYLRASLQQPIASPVPRKASSATALPALTMAAVLTGA